MIRRRIAVKVGALRGQNHFDDGIVPGVTLSGTCDRIDRSPDGRFVVVVDYKRSGRRLDREGEVYLQIPLYALVTSQAVNFEVDFWAWGTFSNTKSQLVAND